MRANVAQYLSAMKQAAAAPGTVSASAQQSFSRLGGQMQSAGRTMTLGITAPLVAAGAASVGMAAQFESSFGMMQGLAGVPQAEIEGLKASVLELAGETANSPQQLAEALYFLRSSGLDASESMEALELSAKASAAGMGETSVIADAVSSAMNAYAASGLSAAEATDILVATARAGKAEPAELAGALGRVLPIASELGITFEDVGGAIAALSLNGNDASTSATLLSNVMSKLLKPSEQAGKALTAVGLSSDGIRQSIADNGLLATLQMLQDKLGDAGFIKFMEDAQAVQGALTLVNDESGNVAAAFANVADHAGATGAAFDAMASTDAMKMKQGLVDVQVAMVQLGSILLPIVANIAGGIADLAGWFADLPAPVQNAAVAVGALAAATGPLLVVGGSLVKNWTAVSKAFTAGGGAAGTATKALGLLGLAVGVGYLAYEAFTRESRELNDRTREVADAMHDEVAAAEALADAATVATTSIGGLTEANAILGQALASIGDNGTKIQKAFGTLGLSISDVVTWMDRLQGNSASRTQALGEMARSAGVAEKHLGVLAKTIEETDASGEDLRAMLYANLREMGYTASAADELAGSLMPVASAMEEVDDQSEKFDGNAITRDYLQLAAGANDYANELIGTAEAQSGLNRNGEHTRSLMAALLDVVEDLPPAEQAAARAALGLDTALGQAATGADTSADSIAVWGQSLFDATAGVDDLNSALPQSERVMLDAAEAAGKWIDGLSVATTEAKGLAGGVDDLNSALPQSERVMMAAAAAAGKWIDGFRVASTESKGLAGAVDDLGGKAGDAAYGLEYLAGAVDDLFASFLSATDPADRMREAIRNVWEEAEETATAMHEAADAGLTLGEAFDVGTETGRANQQQMEENRDAIYEHGAAMLEGGASAEEAAASIAFNTGAMRNNMLQAGYTESEVDALLSTYNLTPEQILTHLRLIGQAQAAAEISTHKQLVNGIPAGKNTTVTVAPSGVAYTQGQINGIQGKTVWITVAERSAAGTSTLGSGWGGSGRAHGGYQDRPEVALWGEDGAEAMFPLTNPARMRELWGDPRISGPMLAALGGALTPIGVQRGTSRPAAAVMSGEVHHHYNANVSNNGRDLTSDDLVRAFSQLRRSA